MSESAVAEKGSGPAAPVQSCAELQNYRITIACAVALVAMLACPMITGETYTGNDLRDFHIPVRQFYARCLETGGSFAWMPGIYCGFYIHGEGQAGMFHPLHYMLYRFLPLEAALTLEMTLNFPLMFAGMYLLLRRWNLRRDACAFGAMVLAFSGFNARHFVHVNALSVMAHVPWILLAIDYTLRCGDRSRARVAAAAVALLTGSQILMGYPQYVWFSLLAEFAYTVAVAWNAVPASRVFLVIAAKVSGLAVAAIQFIPTVDAWSGSVRVAMTEHARNEFRMTPLLLSQMVAPYLLSPQAVRSSPQEYGIYAGAAVPALLLWVAVYARRLREHKRLAAMSIALGLAAIDLSFGSSGLLDPLLSTIPPASLFRAPVRYFGLCQIAIAFAVAVAFNEIARRSEAGEKPGVRRAALLLTPVALAIGAVWLAGWAWNAPAGPSADSLASDSALAAMAGPALVLGAGALIFASSRSVRWALAGLIVFTAIDLGVYGGAFLRSAPVSSVEALAESIPDVPDGDGRIASPTTVSDLWLLKGHDIIEGYAALAPRKSLDYGEPHALRVAGAYRLNSGDSTRPETCSPLDWREITDPEPRARLVSKVIVCPCTQSVISLAGIDVSSTVVLYESVDVDQGAAGTVVVARDDPGRARFSTAAEGRQVLVFSESWDPGWKASVDGAPVRVMRAYGDFMAVPVEQGMHDIEFEFAPLSFAVGAWVTAISAVAVVAFAAWPFARRAGKARQARE